MSRFRKPVSSHLRHYLNARDEEVVHEVVVCDDGSVFFRHADEATGEWHEDMPIPGTAADARLNEELAKSKDQSR